MVWSLASVAVTGAPKVAPAGILSFAATLRVSLAKTGALLLTAGVATALAV